MSETPRIPEPTQEQQAQAKAIVRGFEDYFNESMPLAVFKPRVSAIAQALAAEREAGAARERERLIEQARERDVIARWLRTVG